MDTEKQIEEMARAMCCFSEELACSECSEHCFYKDYAERAYNAPFLVGALLATADAICDGVAKGDEGTAEHLMSAARDVAGFLVERRQVRVVEEEASANE